MRDHEQKAKLIIEVERIKYAGTNEAKMQVQDAKDVKKGIAEPRTPAQELLYRGDSGVKGMQGFAIVTSTGRDRMIGTQEREKERVYDRRIGDPRAF